MNVQLEWVLGALFVAQGTLFTLFLQNRRRINEHDVKLAKLDGLPAQIDSIAKDFNHALEKHELKEDKQFNDMNTIIATQFLDLHRQVNDLVVKVALLAGSKKLTEDIHG